MRRLWTHHDLTSPAEGSVDLFDERAVERLVEESRPDFVINCAAYNNVDGAEGDGREEAFRVNGDLPEILARVTASRRVPLLHFSTDYVFDGNRVEGYAEDDEPSPISAYGASKLEGERNVLDVHSGAYVVRTSRLFGAPGDAQYAKRSFVEIIQDEAREKGTFEVNGQEVSAPTFVDDLAMHIERHILPKPDPGIYHMTNEGGATWFEWAEEILRRSGSASVITPRDPATMNRPAKRPSFSTLRSTKIPPMRPWRDALRAYLGGT